MVAVAEHRATPPAIVIGLSEGMIDPYSPCPSRLDIVEPDTGAFLA